MNGIAEVTIKGVKHQLKFGMQAFLMFQERNLKSSAPVDSLEGGLKAVCDLFYSGLTGYSIRNEKPIKSFGECCDLFDELTLEADFNHQVANLWNVFNESIKTIGTPEIKEPVKKKVNQKK